ncbi:MAG: response regulator [Pseudomonadota bacterium]
MALDLARRVEQQGYTVLGPFQSSAKALTALETETPDVAVLDVSLGASDTSKPVAALLSDRSVPFAFMTGYAATDIMNQSAFSDRPRLSKPCRCEELMDFLEDALTG